MEQDLELNVWCLAQQACDTAAFGRLVEEAVGSFKKDPGFDPTVRLHASGIGTESIRVLRDVLKRRLCRPNCRLRRDQVSSENAFARPVAIAPYEGWSCH